MQNEPGDGELVAATLGGDRTAFEALLDRHVDRVRLLASRMLQPQDAEDVVQEALLQAFLGLDRLRNPERFGSWLYGITLNLARMRLRRRDPLPLDAGLVEGPAVDGETALDAVRDALGVLPRREREAVVLHYVEGLAPHEVAALVGERPGTVRVRLHRARQRLRRQLTEFAPTAYKEEAMIEVGVEDVVVRMSGENGEASGIVDETRIVVLKEQGGERRLPIWVGEPEAAALAIQLGGGAMPRPMTSDLDGRDRRARSGEQPSRGDVLRHDRARDWERAEGGGCAAERRAEPRAASRGADLRCRRRHGQECVHRRG